MSFLFKWFWSRAPISEADYRYRYTSVDDNTNTYGLREKSVGVYSIYKGWLPCAKTLILVFWSLGLLIASYLLHNPSKTTFPTVYTPMEKAIEYEVRCFNQGLWGDRTPFMGTPNEINKAAWHDLTKLGIIKINNEQNSLLPKSSIQYDGYPEYWQGGIEMFHQLHCLYHLRMLIYDETPDVYYGRDSTIDEPAAHVDHCIDHLRQGILCHGSTDIITFRKDAKGRTVPNFDGPHVCRKFEPLREWAEENRAWNFTPEGRED